MLASKLLRCSNSNAQSISTHANYHRTASPEKKRSLGSLDSNASAVRARFGPKPTTPNPAAHASQRFSATSVCLKEVQLFVQIQTFKPRSNHIIDVAGPSRSKTCKTHWLALLFSILLYSSLLYSILLYSSLLYSTVFYSTLV